MSEEAIAPRSNVFWVGGSRLTLLRSDQDTGGSYCLFEIVVPSGVSTIPHMHMLEWEAIFPLSGGILVEAPGLTRMLRPGELAAFPPGIPHRLSNPTPIAARALVVCTPSGFDDFIREVGAPVTVEPHVSASAIALPGAGTGLPQDRPPGFAQVAARHGITLLSDQALLGLGRAPVLTPPEVLDTHGVEIRVLQELSGPEVDLVLFQATVAQDANLPLHGLDGPLLYYVTAGGIEVFCNGPSGGRWTPLGAGAFDEIGPGTPHAVRNVAGRPAKVFIVTTSAVLDVLRVIAQPAEARADSSQAGSRNVGAGHPTRSFADDLLRLARSERQIGYPTTKPKEIVLVVGPGTPRSRLH